jgi:hypothetical protein
MDPLLPRQSWPGRKLMKTGPNRPRGGGGYWGWENRVVPPYGNRSKTMNDDERRAQLGTRLARYAMNS